jgi:hypothetical protein
MTKRDRIILVFSIIMILAGTGIFFYKKDSGSSSKDLLRIDLKSFKIDGGWGYDLKVGSVYSIHQDRIPAIEGDKKFVSEEEALATGRLVIAKIKKHRVTFVTVHELDSLGIHYR